MKDDRRNTLKLTFSYKKLIEQERSFAEGAWERHLSCVESEDAEYESFGDMMDFDEFCRWDEVLYCTPLEWLQLVMFEVKIFCRSLFRK